MMKRIKPENRFRRVFYLVAIVAIILVIILRWVIASPSQATQDSESSDVMLGVNMHPLHSWYNPPLIPQKVDLAQSVGASIIRISIHWSWVEGGETKPSSWNSEKITQLETFLDEASSRNIKVLAVVTGSPCWASSNSSKNCNDWKTYQPYPPSDMQDYTNFVTLLMDRYGDQIQYWQIWNEPNFKEFWAETDAEKYTELLMASYNAIKAKDANAYVVGGTLAPRNEATSENTITYLDAMYQAGAKGYFDILSFHPYTSGHSPSYIGDSDRWPMNRYTISIPAVREVMATYGDDSPLWLTEIGWSTGPIPAEDCTDCGFVSDPNQLIKSEEDQASYLTEAVNIIEQQGWDYVDAFFWYELTDCDSDYSDKCTETSYHSHYGLFNKDLSSKLAATNFRDLALPNKIYLPSVARSQ